MLYELKSQLDSFPSRLATWLWRRKAQPDAHLVSSSGHACRFLPGKLALQMEDSMDAKHILGLQPAGYKFKRHAKCGKGDFQPTFHSKKADV